MPTLVLFVVSVAVALWCLVDLLPREDAELQGLPKVGWVVVLLLFPLLGALAYLLAGRSPQARGARPRPGGLRRPRTGGAGTVTPPARGPEDDPDFQAQLRRRVEEQRRRAARRSDEERPDA